MSVVQHVTMDWVDLGLCADEIQDEDKQTVILQRLTEYAHKCALPLKRGDVLQIDPENAYRNDNTFMWDGFRAVPLFFEIDDYGSLPREFEITDENDLEPDAYFRYITHNRIIWLSQGIRNRIVLRSDGCGELSAAVTIKSREWKVNISSYDEDDREEVGCELYNAAIAKGRCSFYVGDGDDESERVIYVSVKGGYAAWSEEWVR